MSIVKFDCGCAKGVCDLSMYGDTNNSFYYTDSSNCKHQHGLESYNGDECGCYIKFNYNSLNQSNHNTPKTLKVVVFQCPNNLCNVKQLLAEEYRPVFLEYLKNNYLDMDELNVHMYNFINTQ